MNSLWDATNPRATATKDSHADEVDIAIVGGGFTGMWTARYLSDAAPHLRIAVVDAQHCGFGASGRNGGWCSALFPLSDTALAARFGAPAAAAQRGAMRSTVDEVGRAATEDGIDCHFTKGGTLVLATNPAHIGRVREHLADDEVWLDADAASARVRAAGLLGAAFTPHCAALHPGRLARGLAESLVRRGVELHEGTRVTAITPGAVVFDDHRVLRADTVLRCTEGYTRSLAGHRRDLVPLYSLMIATEPLSDAVWDDIGLAGRETFSDGRHLLIYGQRTADGRFAFGGRGAPYHFGSRIQPDFDSDPAVFGHLEATLRELFPQIGSARITHQWGGALGVPRDWMPSVGFDDASRLGWAGGYVGDGVAAANLAGRTLRDLVLGQRTELTALPWVDHRSPRWEPEPLRWLGINAGRALAAAADRYERRTRRTAGVAERAMGWFTGD